MLVLVEFASALTLEEAVARAGELSPLAVVAELEWRRAQLDAAERYSALSVTPGVTFERSYVAGAAITGRGATFALAARGPAGWLDAFAQSAQARWARRPADATLLDAQYAAAFLYFDAWLAEDAVTTARRGADDA